MTPPSATTPAQSPRFGAAQIRLLERLCNACAVSGDEGEVRSIVLEQIRPFVDEVNVDALGNVLAVRHGQGDALPRVLLAAHMDEVGFMLTEDEKDGFYRFEKVGGIDERLLAGKAVQVGHKHIPGVIGATPIHLTDSEERADRISLNALHIDLGPEADKVKIGDWATFATLFQRVGPSLFAKALDDRLGVATLIEIIKQAPPQVEILAAFTVQEEVGLRGAQVAAYALNPAMAIVLDSTLAGDLPTWDDQNGQVSENTHYNSRLGAGPAIYLADHYTLSDPRLVRHIVATAEAAGIPYQFRQPGGGGTDAGAIHEQRSGIPTVSISTPGRYPHTPITIARLSDWKNTFLLVHAALATMGPEVLADER